MIALALALAGVPAGLGRGSVPAVGLRVAGDAVGFGFAAAEVDFEVGGAEDFGVGGLFAGAVPFDCTRGSWVAETERRIAEPLDDGSAEDGMGLLLAAATGRSCLGASPSGAPGSKSSSEVVLGARRRLLVDEVVLACEAGRVAALSNTGAEAGFGSVGMGAADRMGSETALEDSGTSAADGGGDDAGAAVLVETVGSSLAAGIGTLLLHASI